MAVIWFGILPSCQRNYDVIRESKHYKLEKLADGVFAAIHNNEGGYAICNAGIIDLGDITLVLDPFISPVAARDLKRDAEHLTGKPVSLVLNLHPHSDHTNGNQVFMPEANIIGTHDTRKYIEEHFYQEMEYYKNTAPKELLEIQRQIREATGDEKVELILMEAQYKAVIASLPELKMTLPNITISDTMIIHGAKRKVVIIPTGTGHSPGDMVAYLPEEKIIFMSDQLFVKCHPYLADGDLESLKTNLKKIIALNPAITVPGHGPVGDLNSLNEMVDYIETLTTLVDSEIQKGTDEQALVEVPVPEKFKDWLIKSFYKINLRFIYQKMMESNSNI